MVLTSTRGGEERIAAPDGPGDDLGALIAEFACDLRKEAVIADHHPNPADGSVKNRIVRAGSEAGFDLAARQADLAVFADERAVRADEGSDVVDGGSVLLDQADDEVQEVLFSESTKIFCAGSRNGLGALVHFQAGAVVGERFREDDEIGFLRGGLGDEGGELGRLVLGAFAFAGLKVNCGEADFAWRRRGYFGEGDGAPSHTGVWQPLEIQLDARLSGLKWRAQDVLESAPIARCAAKVSRVFGFRPGNRADGVTGLGGLFPGDGFALGVLPNDSGIDAPPQRFSGLGLNFPRGAELIVRTARDG